MLLLYLGINAEGKSARNVVITCLRGAFMQRFLQYKKISIAYSKIMFVALGIQRTMRRCHIVICCLHDFKTFFHFMS